ncbi:hypothetical protein ACHAQE_009925 [Botrytis cinerea]
MSPTTPNRLPDKSGVPRSFILNWQSSKAQGAKPLIRRPITACEACRSAKVKWPTSLELEQAVGSSDISQERSIESSIDLETDSTDILIPNNSSLNLEDLAITRLFTQLSPTYPSFQPTTPTTSESYNGALEMPIGKLTTKSSSNHAPPHKDKAPITCQRRSRLTLFIPKITSVMEESPTPKLDNVFKATREVIQSCQDMIDCTSCQLSCSDLMCLLLVFQHTDACFTHISKVDLAHATTVSIGGYEFSITNDIRPRQMLVMDLGRQANTLLDSITAVEETLAASPCAANRLNEVNSEFLKNVKDAFRENLQAATDSVNRAT